ncbi:MAG: tetratricopeptide repeat protein [Bacteroidota bacterium]|nr:tetratricopeptide repeat protein [Bacteroidota bacterium]
MIYQNPDNEYRLGVELFGKQMFGAAKNCFQNVLTNKNSKDIIRSNSEFFSAICSAELFNEDAEYQLTEFIRNNPGSYYTKNCYFQLGRVQHRKKRYRQVIESFKNVDIYSLNNDELAEYYFKLGHSYFNLKDYGKAKKAFYEIKDVNTRYSSQARYFYAHISYVDKNYEVALQDFLKLINDENFSSVVPYYIAQIYYLLEKYDELLEYAPTLLDSTHTKRTPEIARLVGEAYYKTGKYKNAIPYLEQYQSQTKGEIKREDIYELAYANYMVENYDKTIKSFEKITGIDDSLTQNAYYLSADCYLKTGEKQFAKNMFLSAYKLEFYPSIKEDALFNYAKLSYELSQNAYNEAVIALQKYIKEFPQSQKLDEVYSYLVNLFLTTKNYKDALISIENIKNKNEKLKSAYQKIAYYRGLELFNNMNYANAINHFKKALLYKKDKSFNSLAFYWSGEAYYRLKNYDSAIVEYKTFIETPGAIKTAVYNEANYNTAYCYFNLKNYSAALSLYRTFVNNKENEQPKLINDAYTRIGDCYFISKDYENSIENYNKVIEMKGVDADYALFQQSKSYGVLGKNELKAKALTSLINNYKKSTYYEEAIYDLGETYIQLNENNMALTYFNRLIDEFPNTNYCKKALLKAGLIYFNNKNDVMALQTFKRIVTQYPSTNESKEALVSIRNIYVDMDSVENFFVYAKKLPFAVVSSTEQDSITYIAVENRYMNGDCNGAVSGFKNYLEKYPYGYFVINANFYIAECLYKVKEDSSLAYYEYVISKPDNKFTERSIMKASAINFNLKNYERALNDFNKFEEVAENKLNIIDARAGQMRCNFILKKYKDAIESCKKIFVTEKAPEELISEAHFTYGRSALAMDSLNSALNEFKTTYESTKSVIGAEAKYNVAEIFYKQGLYKESEKVIFELINQVPSYDYWIAKGFILLADNYVKTDNVFQAKHTLQSIIDNYEGKDLVDKAKDKLKVITDNEKIKEQKKSEEEVKIKFGEDNDKEKDLFEQDDKEKK